LLQLVIFDYCNNTVAIRDSETSQQYCCNLSSTREFLIPDYATNHYYSDFMPSLNWPVTTYEERWHYSLLEPYYSAVAPEIAEAPRAEIRSDFVADACDAMAEIARFDAEMIANHSNLIQILLRCEAVASSYIEHIHADARRVALAELTGIAAPARRRAPQTTSSALAESAAASIFLAAVSRGSTASPDLDDGSARFIVANAKATQLGIDLASDFDESSIIVMHEILLNDSRPDWTGHWREAQVRIGGSSVLNAKFVAPHPERVAAEMGDFAHFMQRIDLPTFEHAAIAHAQFETIHPFPDGNGRVGRALVHVLFKKQGLSREVVVPFSAGLLCDVDNYYSALDDYRYGNVDTIIGILSNATFRGIGLSRRLVGNLSAVRERWQRDLRARSDSSAWQLLDLVLAHPAIDVTSAQHELGVAFSTAENAIGQLVDAGVLEATNEDRRNRRWIATEVVTELDGFLENAKRSKFERWR
jgi:Fic family protein